MDDDKRYKLFKLFLIFTILNIFGIFLYEKLMKFDELSKAKIYYVSVLPYVNKSKYKIRNKDIIKFNSIMKEKLSLSKINYVDAYGLLTATEEYKNETTDGLHYSAIIYDKIFEKIISSIMQNS